MNLDGTLTQKSDGTYVVAFDRLIGRPVAKVWAALTEESVLKNWLGNVEVDLRVGGKYIIRFRDMTVVMTGRITALEPERLLEYTWLENYGMPQSLARWELSPEGSATRLRLTHALPPECKKSDVLGFLGGWHAFLDVMARGADGQFVPYADQNEKEIDAGYRARHGGDAAPKENGESAKVPCVTFERVLPGPIERVWAHLTDPNRLPAWFGENSTIEARPGGKVSLMGGHVRGVVTQCAPPHRLTYTWNVFAPDDGADAVSAYPESYLSFTLESCGADVRLRLHHLPVLERFVPQNAMGWHTFLDILGAALRGETVQERSAYMTKNAALYGVDLSNLAR